jgi:hypothetical protein
MSAAMTLTSAMPSGSLGVVKRNERILAGKPLSPAAEGAGYDDFVLVQGQMHQLGTVVCERCRDSHLGHAQRFNGS